MDDPRGLILVEANWQASPLIALLQKTPSIRELVELRLVGTGEERDRLLFSDGPDSRRLAGFWQQVTDFWIAERWEAPVRLPDGIAMTRFPYLGGDCFWPLLGSDPRNRPEALYPDGRYRLSDRFAAELSGSTADDDALYDTYLARSAEGLADLEARWQHEMAVATGRDALCEVRFAPTLESAFRDTRLFHAPGSPNGPAYEVLALGLAARLEALLDRERDSLVDAVRVHARGFQGISQYQYPVHPVVAERLELRWASPGTAFRVGKNRWTHREATVRAIRWLDWTP